MPADAELRIRAAVEQAIGALRQVKGEIVGVKHESRAAAAAQTGDAARNVASTVKQREALVVLAREYKVVGASAKRGSEEAAVAQKLSADATRRANVLLAEQRVETGKVREGHNLLGKTMGIVFGGAIAAKGLEEIVNVAKEAQQSQTQLSNTMKNAGQSYAGHRKEIEGAIEAESNLAGVQRVELRTSFMNLDRLTMSTTKGLRDMGLATDIARARHMGMSQATKLVMMAEMGRVAMLRRMGIQLPTITTAEDKLRDSHAKVSAEVKRQAKEWDVQHTAIAAVAALHKAYAGSAEKYGKTAAGATDRLKVVWQDFGIEMGNKVLPVITKASTWLANEISMLEHSRRAHELLHKAVGFVVAVYKDLLPLIKAVLDVTRDVAGWFVKHEAAAKILAGAVVALYTGYKIYTETVKVVTAVTKAWATVQKLLNAEMALNPVGLVVVAIAALAAGIYLAYQHSATFRRIVNEVAKVLKEVFVGALHAAKNAAVTAFDFIKKHWQLLLAIFGGPLGVVVGIVIKHFHAIAQAVTHPIKTMRAAWDAIFTWLETKAIEVALKIIEPFSHLPKWLGGGWAQDMKKNLNSALDGLKDPAAQAGNSVGTAFGDAFLAASTSKMEQAIQAGTAAGPSVTGSGLAVPEATGTKAQRGIVNVARQVMTGPNARYVYGGGGAGGPSDSAVRHDSFHFKGFDCSGFAQYVLAQNGITVPRTSEAQAAGGVAVPLGELAPGDLVFTEGWPHPGHVGIYIGGGRVIEDPHTGASIRVTALSAFGPTGVGKRYWKSSSAKPGGSGRGGGTKPAETAPSQQTWTTDTSGTTPTTAVDKAIAAAGKGGGGGGLSKGGVATMSQAVKDLQEKIRGILPSSLRAELEKRAEQIIGGIHKGLSAEKTAALRSTLKKLSGDVSEALRFDKAEQTARDSMAKLSGELKALPANLRGPLRAELGKVSALFGHIVTAKDLAAAKSSLADLKKHVAAALKLDTGIAAARSSVATIKKQLVGWPAAIQAPLQSQVAALSKVIGKVLTPADLKAAQGQLAKLKTAVSAAMQEAKNAVSDAQAVFQREWQRFSDAALAAFDKVTEQMIKTHRVTVQMSGYSFDYGQGEDTPAARAIAAMQAAHETAQRTADVTAADDAVAKSAQALADARKAAEEQAGKAAAGRSADQQAADAAAAKSAQDLAAAQATAAQTAAAAQQNASDENVKAAEDAAAAVVAAQQAVADATAAVTAANVQAAADNTKAAQDAAAAIDQAQQDLSDKQKARAELDYQAQLAALQVQADAEKTAADTQFQTWQDAYQNTRDVQKSVLQDQLTDLEIAIENQKTTWSGAMTDIKGILSQGGDAASKAFWSAFNAASAATAAAGGQDPSAAAAAAAAALAGAQGQAAATGAIPAAPDQAAIIDPGAGTRPDDRGGVRGAPAAGFVWGGITWGPHDKAAFVNWLKARGSTYATWSANHQTAAATFLAQGGWVTRPTLAMMGEKPGGRGEGVIPLDDPRALTAIGQAIAAAMPGGGGDVYAVFPNAIVPGRDRDAANRLARMTAPAIRRTIGYNLTPGT